MRNNTNLPSIAERNRPTWKTVPLIELCELVNGRGFKPHEWKKDGVPIIRIQNLNGSEEFNYYQGEFDPKILVEPGSLLFAWSGSRGTSFGPRIWNGPQGVLNYHTWRVMPRAGVCRDYLFQLLELETSRIEASSHGAAALVHVQKWEMERRTFSVPSFPAQRKIAEVLRTWDEAIEKLEALRAAKEKLASAIADDLIFGVRRVVGYPKPWPSRRLADVTRELTRRNRDEAIGRDLVMGVSNSRGIVPMREQTIAADISRYLILPPRAFAYNPMRINVGSIAMSRFEHDVLVSPDYVLFECLPGKLDPDFLDHLRQSHFWSHYINAGGTGSVRMRTYYDDLAALRLKMPPHEEQLAISEVLNTAQSEVRLVESQIAALARQKRGLMQKLLTGEWRVTSRG